LVLIVNPNGSRWWRLMFGSQDKAQMLSLGTYPDVRLKRARGKRDEARRRLAEEINPGGQLGAHRPTLFRLSRASGPRKVPLMELSSATRVR